MSKIITESEKVFIDHQTGEIKQISHLKVLKFDPEPPFVKMYIDDLCALKSVPGSLKDVLTLMLRRLDYEGYVTLSQRIRNSICTELSILQTTLSNRLSKLIKTDLIRRTGNNEFKVNPHYFARGSWRDIVEQRKAFTMTTTYSGAGRSVSVETIEERVCT
jgi:hypothetical protein